VSQPWLKPGRYHVDMFLCTEGEVVDHFPQACVFEVNSVMPYAFSASSSATQSGVVLADFSWHAHAVAPASQA
jgi:lipopolysaccharide transport system ATP-binding protein